MHDAMSGAWKFDALFHTKRAEDRRFETGRAMENVLALTLICTLQPPFWMT